MLWRAPNIFLHVDGTLTRTEATLTKARATLDNLDKGTKVWADSAKEQTGVIEDLATDAHGTLSEANRALQGLSTDATALKSTVDASTQLLISAKQSTDALTVDLNAIKQPVDNLNPLIIHADKAVDHFDALLSRPALVDTVDGLGKTSQNLGRLTADLYVWSHPLLNPDPCTTAACRWKKGLSVAGSFAGFGSNLYGAKALFEPLTVRVKR